MMVLVMIRRNIDPRWIRGGSQRERGAAEVGARIIGLRLLESLGKNVVRKSGPLCELLLSPSIVAPESAATESEGRFHHVFIMLCCTVPRPRLLVGDDEGRHSAPRPIHRHWPPQFTASRFLPCPPLLSSTVGVWLCSSSFSRCIAIDEESLLTNGKCGTLWRGSTQSVC
ncbi:hypothetical protein Mp_1g26490 [Marchantia polymorpha subsp. ruderalis]|uniref:Uncharacterized protein n=2 Tax=Marchantia polymorpha TaxID=3197 RepID=A0AAF6AUI9_MARPO|nr:hypothetical protein MARPO_0002s0229 [Marchantia polymorpha]PTQ49775.1 hypothetical protein MARPO_0002s0229 [Marchantia polymorpha]BBN00109.1 hypothetical protein Mp_1g26490 [Marchantia polymorpha subsp. ruderalis]BBN00110.1 hypothetical protein Mp_1g26490 [Marchantia polymorpha subsp. ruderalis]|eukprot:PTQ49774.1 hypothetical protein MARPO_0002s0229 [Marchantia polymorpha]